MKKAKIQNELLSKGVSYKGYELLEFLKDSYFTDVVGAELQKRRPLVFRESRDVKQGFDELVGAELIRGEYNKGNITGVTFDVQLLISLEDVSSGLTITKKVASKKSAKTDIPEEIKDIAKHYNSHACLPRPSTLTPLAIQRISEKLDTFSPEQIKEAIDVAANAEWLVKKGSENWCNISWVIGNIDGFMPGGKYHKEHSVATSKYQATTDNSNVEVFW